MAAAPIAVDRAEVSLTVDQGIAQVEGLRHADERVVNGGVTVRVIVLHHFADRTGTLAVAGGGAHAHFPHGEEHAAVDRLQAIAGIRKRALNDDAHRVVEIRLPHFGIDVRDANVSNIHESRVLCRVESSPNRP